MIFVLQNVQFFFPLLKLSIMGNYGHAKLSSKEYAEKERDGTLTPQEIADQRLPGPFSLYPYMQHVVTPNTREENHLNPLPMMQ